MSDIRLRGEELEVYINVDTIVSKIRNYLELTEFEVFNRKVGYYSDQGLHNREYVFHPCKDKQKYLKVLEAIEVIEEALNEKVLNK